MAGQKRSAELDEIWSLFAQEGNDNLNLAEDALLKLEQDPEDPEQVKVLFRAFHSFKGGARMMGLGVIESLGHKAEDLIGLVRDDGVMLEPDMIDLLLAVLDKFRVMLDFVVAEGVDVQPEQAADLIAKLQQMIAETDGTKSDKPNGPDARAKQSDTIDLSVKGSSAAAKTIVVSDTAPKASVESTGITKASIPVADSTKATGSLPVDENPARDIAVPVDATRLAEFLKKTESDLAKLHTALDALMAGAPEAQTQFQSVVSDLKTAAATMGYQRLVSVLCNLEGEAISNARPLGSTDQSQERFVRFKKLELEIFEELTHIQDHNSPGDIGHEDNWTDIAWLFRHWNAEQVYADLARLTEIADELDRQIKEFSVEAVVARQSEKLAEEAMVLLKAIYHSCIFYHLDQAVYLSLELADIYGRVAQSELITGDALTRLTRTFVTSLGSAIDAIREGSDPVLSEFDKLISQAQNFLYLHTDGPVFQVTRSVLDVLNLPIEFKEVMTPETMAKFGRALQAGEHFYTILADLERDEALGRAFLQWSQSDGIHLITNITVYRYNRTLFNFLMATTQSREEILASLIKMDPDWQYLTLEECVLREQVDVKAPREDTSKNDLAADAALTSHGGGVSSELIESISETLSTLVADHATLRRVANRLVKKDLVDAVFRMNTTTNGTGGCTRGEIEDGLKEWADGINTLYQVEGQVRAALSQLQEATRSLRLVPVADMLVPLRRMVHELAQRQGKLVDLDLQGTELELDRGAIETLSELVRRLVWFAVTHGIEDVERRRAVGKAAAGRVLVKVLKNEDHAQVVIEDDGCGLDREPIRNRARKMGLVNGNGGGASELDWMLKPGFGLVGSRDGVEGIDLASIAEQLRARHGRMSATSEMGQGTRFDIRLPLDVAVIDGMVVRVGEVRYIVPVNTIRRMVKIETGNLVHSSAEGDHTMLKFEDGLVQIQALAGNETATPDQGLVMIVDTEAGRTGLLIDELIGRQQVLVHPLQGQLSDVQDVSGCALLGEGEVGMVLSMQFNGHTPSVNHR